MNLLKKKIFILLLLLNLITIILSCKTAVYVKPHLDKKEVIIKNDNSGNIYSIPLNRKNIKKQNEFTEEIHFFDNNNRACSEENVDKINICKKCYNLHINNQIQLKHTITGNFLNACCLNDDIYEFCKDVYLIELNKNH